MRIEGVTAEWDRPAKPSAVLLLGHGAGGDLNDDLLRTVARDLVEHSVATLRFNFPYREAGRKAPGAQSQSEELYRALAAHARDERLPLLLGGKSYGGRIASHIVAQGFECHALVFLSYPLHPPGRPERIRDAHLKDIRLPILFVQGTRDSFATPDLLRKTVTSLKLAELVPIEGGDHSLKVKGRPRGDVLREVVGAVRTFVERRVL